MNKLVPAASSPTATMLRLNLNNQPRVDIHFNIGTHT